MNIRSKACREVCPNMVMWERRLEMENNTELNAKALAESMRATKDEIDKGEDKGEPMGATDYQWLVAAAERLDGGV